MGSRSAHRIAQRIVRQARVEASGGEHEALLDRELGDLLATYPVRVNVMIVSDHGHAATTENPHWRGWHDREGIFIGTGPDFQRCDAVVAVSYFDIVPTIIDVLGFPAPEGLHGVPARCP